MRVGVVESIQQCPRGRVVGAALQAERPLSNRGEYPRLIEHFGDLVGEPQAYETGLCEDRGIKILLHQLAQARFDVAAHVDEFEIGPTMQKLRLAAQAAGADDGA